MYTTQWLKMVSAMLVAGATGSGVDVLAQQGNSRVESRSEASVKAATANDTPVHLVKPGKLSVTVAEKGTVEASRTTDAYCRVKGRVAIRSILPDGALVAEGQLVCELDSSQLKERLVHQSFSEKQAGANYQNAKLTREIAETALLESSKAKLQNGQDNLKQLKAEIEKYRSEELAKRANWEVEKSTLKKIGIQIASCTIFAPADGLLVHANDPFRFERPQPMIAVGATVRERQKIFVILDIRGPMHVSVKIRESMIDQIEPGLKALIRVDAFPADLMTGSVREVAPLPDSTSWFHGEIKYYTTKVQLDKRPKAFRPGMTAQVEIKVAELDNVLSVPVESVVRYHDKDHVAVKKSGGGFEWREVTLGLSNDQCIEVKQGIKSGELVATQPQPLLSEEQRRKIGGTATEPDAKESDLR